MKWMHPSDLILWDAAFGRSPPTRLYSTAQKTTCEEDVVFVEEQLPGEDSDLQWALYCVCDGHAGVEAARHIKQHLWASLKPRLPKAKPERTDGFASWAEHIRHAIRDAFESLDDNFIRQVSDDCEAGSTLTVALSCGWFLTVANLGDTEAVVDTGSGLEVMTHSHRLEECEKERNRLTKAGVTLARLGRDLSGPAEKGDFGIGPQRCWPGGLANSRAIGDMEGGQHIVSSPFIKQCILPHKGCRLIIGSDGLWDMINHQTACVLTRANGNKSSAERLVTMAIYRNNWAVHDDTTALVVDFLSDSVQDFPQICKIVRKRKKGSSTLFSCFCSSGVKDEDREEENVHMLINVAEVDCAVDSPDRIFAAIDAGIINSETERTSSGSVEC